MIAIIFFVRKKSDTCTKDMWPKDCSILRNTYNPCYRFLLFSDRISILYSGSICSIYVQFFMRSQLRLLVVTTAVLGLQPDLTILLFFGCLFFVPYMTGSSSAECVVSPLNPARNPGNQLEVLKRNRSNQCALQNLLFPVMQSLTGLIHPDSCQLWRRGWRKLNCAASRGTGTNHSATRQQYGLF